MRERKRPRALLSQISMLTTGSKIVKDRMRGVYHLKTPQNPFFEILSDGAWKGKRCFIIGGGSSLKGFDFERLKGEKVIVINAAFKFCMFADILFFMDKGNFYLPLMRGNMNDGDIKEAWEKFEGYKVFLDLLHNRAIPGCYTLYSHPINEGITHSMKKGLVHGDNSGHGALNLAHCLGANPIYLLGYDFYFSGPKKQSSHFHNIYKFKQGEATFKSFIKFFNKSSEILRRMGIQVYNCNPNSSLRFFDFANIDELLEK